MIVVFGSINIDLVTRVERLPGAGETVLGPDYAVHPGGKGANQALAARRAGAEVVLVGAAGRDGFGETALSLLAADGVALNQVARLDAPTGAAFIAIDRHGANQIIVAAGANAEARADALRHLPIGPDDILLLQREVPEPACIEAARLPWIVVPFVAMMAALATFLCNALRVGPPGAYLFALACAAGTALPAAHLSTWHTALLVFAGGAFAWIVHMTGALIWPRGPERAAVTAATNAVAHFIEAIGTPQQDIARHAAALAMHDSWAALVSRQPARPRPDGTLTRLRALNRELHLLFATALNTPPSSRPGLLPAAAERALRVGTDRLCRVLDQVQEHLDELVAIGEDRRQ